MGIRPAVIFVTAFEGFAVEAFDLAAIDYMLKPVAHDRLTRGHSERVAALTAAIIPLPRQMAERFVAMLPVRMVAPPEELPALAMTLIQHSLYTNAPENVWLYSELTAFAKSAISE